MLAAAVGEQRAEVVRLRHQVAAAAEHQRLPRAALDALHLAQEHHVVAAAEAVHALAFQPRGAAADQRHAAEAGIGCAARELVVPAAREAVGDRHLVVGEDVDDEALGVAEHGMAGRA